MALYIDGFTDSVFTTQGKLLFLQEGYLKIEISSFKYSGTVGTIAPARTTQTDIKISKPILAGSAFNNLGVVGYKIETRVDAFEVATPFEVQEVGLYAIDPITTLEVLVWVGEMTYPTPYDSRIELSINIFIPITDQDIKIDLETNPQRIADHNQDINSHDELRQLTENSKLHGTDISTTPNQVILNNPIWFLNKTYFNYTEPKAYLFLASNTNTGATTLKETGKSAIPLLLGGNELLGGEILVGRPYYAMYKATPTPRFELATLGQEIIKSSVWRFQITVDGQVDLPTFNINPLQNINDISLNIAGAEVIDMSSFTIDNHKIVTTWDTLLVGQWIRVEALKIGQASNNTKKVWRFQITSNGQTVLPVQDIETSQLLGDISLNIEGLEILDLSDFTLNTDNITTTWNTLTIGQWVRVEATKT